MGSINGILFMAPHLGIVVSESHLAIMHYILQATIMLSPGTALQAKLLYMAVVEMVRI